MNTKRGLSFVLITIFTLMMACNLGSVGENAEAQLETTIAETVAAQITQSLSATLLIETDTPLATTTLTPLPSATPTLTATEPPAATVAIPATAVPCNRAQFVADVTYPDDSEVTTNNTFVKTWRLKNNGSCTWSSGYRLVFSHGDAMSAPAEVAFTGGTVAPGETVDVSVNLTAPATTGTYRGDFRLKAPDGQVFGIGPNADATFYVQIKAVFIEVFIPFSTLPPFIIEVVTKFTASYYEALDCGGSVYKLSFQINNTGAATLESFQISIKDLTSGQTYLKTRNKLGAASGCYVVAQDSLPGSKTGYIIVQFPDSLAGHNMQATVTACTKDDLQGVCIDKSISFIGGTP